MFSRSTSQVDPVLDEVSTTNLAWAMKSAYLRQTGYREWGTIIVGVLDMYPRFLGIGAQKAGTTWLHEMLSSHEEIWLPHLKELHYFDRKFPIGEREVSSACDRKVLSSFVSARIGKISGAKVIDRLKIRRWPDLLWDIRYLFGDWSDDWYGSLFENARGRLPGEITPA